MRDRLVMIALVLAGCGSAATENVADSQRSCQLTVGFRPGMAPELAKRGHIAADPVLAGSWVPPAQDWQTARAGDGTEWRLLTVSPPPGLWQYAFDVGGTRVLDEANPRGAFGSDGSEVSELDV